MSTDAYNLGTNVARVYHGKARTCCCGCAGTYSSNKATISRAVNKVLALMASPAQDTTIIDERDGNVPFLSVESGGRMVTLYYAEQDT